MSRLSWGGLAPQLGLDSVWQVWLDSVGQVWREQAVTPPLSEGEPGHLWRGELTIMTVKNVHQM